MTPQQMIKEMNDKGISYRLMADYVRDEAIKLNMDKGLSQTMLRRIAENDKIWTRYEKAIKAAHRRLCK